ncbi:Mediator of RNA polymerase II transcription subunit 9, partial [Frankliniella fusca]
DLGRHVAELVSNQTDVTITESTLTEARLQLVETVAFSTLSCFSWMVPKWGGPNIQLNSIAFSYINVVAGQPIGVLRSVVGEFSSAVWAALMLAVPQLCALLYAATRVRDPRPRPRPRLRAQRPDAGQVALGLLSLLLDKPFAGRWAWARAALSVRGVLTILLGTNLVVTTAYKSTLLTTVTLRRPRADIETPEELFATGLRLRMPQVVLSMLRSDPNNLEPRLRTSAGSMFDKVKRVENILEFFDGLVTRRDTAVLDNRLTFQFYRTESLRWHLGDKLYQLKGCYAEFVESPVLLRRGSPLNPSFSWMWLAFNQAGLTDRWLRLLIPGPGPVELAMHRALEMRDLVAAFYLLGIGWLLAAFSLAMEQSYARRQCGSRRRGLLF